MFQPDINTYLEAIRQQYELLLKENKHLKHENKRLMEINHEYKKKIFFYKDIYKTTNLIKQGSDWSVEGFKIFNIHLIKKYFYRDIRNITVTKTGRIIFIHNNIVNILENTSSICEYRRLTSNLSTSIPSLSPKPSHIPSISATKCPSPSILKPISDRFKKIDYNIYQIINDSIVAYDEYQSKKFKISNTGFNYEVRYVLDENENLYVFQNNFLKKYNLLEKEVEDSLNMPNYISMVIHDNLIYLTCYDKSFRIYDKDKLILMINSNEDIKSNLVIINNVGYSISTRNNLLVFDIDKKSIRYIKLFNNENRTYEVSGKMIDGKINDNYMDNERYCRLFKLDSVLVIRNNNNLIFYNTTIKDAESNCIIRDIEIEEEIKSLSVINKQILVGSNDKIVIYDYKNNKKMFIKINGFDVRGISCNSENIVVEGIHTLRIFEYK